MAILPIVTYNDAVLRKKADLIGNDSPELQALIDDMFETMYNSHGIGLAAPQIGKPLQLFVIDPDPMIDEPEPKIGKMVFLNPVIESSSGERVSIEEGCLSIPDIREEVVRFDRIVISFQDRSFVNHQLEASGWLSRVIQHEYDHLQGKLFIDYLGSFRRRLLKNRLEMIERGEVRTDYPLVSKS